ncbi:hypothetical protein EV198_1920 [Roseivirga ehrenbergii]|uniref:Lipoprotein n=1 Tax=Roseivirga ehrenbergii (strain DSM 102268 / JCM 13514 / KCTC 12282 / NCIMB 14502 / KMM 6017) TaxID=279360 RepID=A0A150XSJ1_ROSEK|nr:hypothetical protein [Roseivirga ehrenbergii]KYG81710.1 hypothetical protein MB14_14110 [Roseivirga ehrenbergii]TCL10888.1 hypothetical protein EV198_1920 [Roseivirga ehrenbergii]
MKKVFLSTLILLVLVSCTTTKRLGYVSKISDWNLSHLTEAELKMANDLLSYGLEHEALYTLMDTLKPISSLGFSLSYPIAKASEMKDGQANVVDLKADSVKMALEELSSWNKVLKALSNDNLEFLLIPYKQSWQGKRNLQMLVCRKDLFAKVISEKANFFGQWGFTANSDPATVLTTIEFESKNDRYRAYGYLFGYPDYAVDFFVEASSAEDESGAFVKRDFFSIPVKAGKSGYFTYAIPKGYVPTQTDSAIFYAASTTLQYYEVQKSNYGNSEDGINAIRMISDYWARSLSNQ